MLPPFGSAPKLGGETHLADLGLKWLFLDQYSPEVAEGQGYPPSADHARRKLDQPIACSWHLKCVCVCVCVKCCQ